MFNTLRQGSTLYILDKTNVPILTVAKVTGFSTPVPKYGNLQNPAMPEMVMDIKAESDTGNYDFQKVPSNLSIYSINGVTFSESRDAMNSEVEAIRSISQNAIDNMEFHRKTVESCDAISLVLNPEKAKAKEYEDKMSSLEQEVSGMRTALSEVLEFIKSKNN